MYTVGFIIKVKKILECICVNCGKLKADIVSCLSFPTRFVPPLPNFLGALSISWRTPNPYHVSALTIEAFSLFCDGGCARFRSLDCRATHYIRSESVGHEVCGEMGG